MRGRGIQVVDARGRSWGSPCELAHGGGLEAGSFPSAAQNQVARCVRGAAAKALEIEVPGAPAVAADFSSGAPRVSNEEIGLERTHRRSLLDRVDPGLLGLRRSPEPTSPIG